MALGADPSPTPESIANREVRLPSARENLNSLEEATQPDEQAKVHAQVAEYEHKIEESPNAEDTPAYLIAMGNLYRQKLGEHEKAASCYERIIAEFPESSECRQAFLQLEVCYLTEEDRTGLKWLYRKMLGAFPDDSQEHQYAEKQLENL